MKNLVVLGYDICLKDISDGRGSITVRNDKNYWSYEWGAMGKNANIEKFIIGINKEYFSNKLRAGSGLEFNVGATFANLRRYFPEYVKWYENAEFAKAIRGHIRDFQERVEMFGREYYMIHAVDLLDKIANDDHLINGNRTAREFLIKDIRNNFDAYSFVVERKTQEVSLLEMLHTQLKKKLQYGLHCLSQQGS